MVTENSRQAELEEKRRFWKQCIEDWKSSDLTQVDYCRRHDLLYHRFVYWKRKFQPVLNPALIELKLPTALSKISSPASPLRVSVSRFQVAVERDFDAETLRQLIYSLERL